MNERRPPLGKARLINQDPLLYGTFAEIGAGQEVARYFFQAGRASQTVAKTMSAYDMTFSDEIYGREKSGRYVCESRLNKMLEKEYELLPARLNAVRGKDSHFFAFASTLATGSPPSRRCHGWMGVRFQTEAFGPTSDVVLHVEMLDPHRLQQQEVIGILGVNLLFASFYLRRNPSRFLDTLTEDIKEGRLRISVIRFRGPAFSHFDDALVNLALVQRNLCNAAIFSPAGDLLFSGDLFFQKPLLLHRATFAPPTFTHLEILEKATEQIQKELPSLPLVLCEISLPEAELTTPQAPLLEDLYHRVRMLNQLGYHAMVSRFPLFYELKSFLRTYTQEPLHFAVSATLLEKLFDGRFYQSLEGGLLEGLSRLLDSRSHLSIYPYKTEQTCFTLKTFSLATSEQKILDYFIEKGWIQELGQCEMAQLSYHPEDVRKVFQTNPDPAALVSPQLPPSVLTYIQTNNLYPYGKSLLTPTEEAPQTLGSEAPTGGSSEKQGLPTSLKR